MKYSEDPRGPVLNPGMKIVIDSDGVQARGFRYDPAEGRKTSPWNASWIKPAGMCRKEITLKAALRAVRAWISAEARYKLYVNGRLVSRGPIDEGRDGAWKGKIRRLPPDGRGRPRLSSGLWFYDCRDLTMFFRRGSNVIAVEVAEDKPFLFEARIVGAGGCVKVIASDDSWSGARKCKVYHPEFLPGDIPPRMETIYPMKEIVRATPGVFVPKKPFRGGNGVIFKTDGSFAVKFDRVLSAYVALAVKGVAGMRLRVQCNETDAPGGVRTFEIVLKGGWQNLETPFYDSYTVINITAENVTGPVEIKDVRAVFTSYPVTYLGSFECNDSRLNGIWKACRWCAQLCMQDYHLDSPNHQEPLADPGDYMILALINYYAFGEQLLARQDIRKFARILESVNYRNFHTSYALLWLQMLVDYHNYTGDAGLAKETAPYVHGLMKRFAGYVGRNGLISEAPDYMFMDFVDIAGFNAHHPPAVIGQGYMTAFYYRALRDARAVAEITGETNLAGDYAQRSEKVKVAFNRELWDAGKGLYRDGRPFQTSAKTNRWLPEDKDIETFSPHVNTLAVLYDLAPLELQADIMEKVMSVSPLNCQPYFMHFVFGALRHSGLFDKYGTVQMRRWRIVPETGTFREMWDRGDYSHGWQCTPLIHLSSCVLGVTPASPGCDRLKIKPVLCGLKWARGTIPTPRGDASVSWNFSKDKFTMEVSIPRGCKAEVILPVPYPGRPRVTMDGNLVSGTVCQAGSGKHRFVVVGGGNHKRKWKRN
jgi:hypothetical protein